MRERLSQISFFLLFLICTQNVMGQGQNFDGCLSHSQLYELYSGNTQTMGQMMGRQRFFMVSNDNNVSFFWDNDTLQLNMCNWQFAQGFNDIYVNAFYKEGYYNFVEYNTTAACANKLLQECKEKYMEQYDEDADIEVNTSMSDSLSGFPMIKNTAPQLTFDFKEGYQILFPEKKTNNDQFLIQIYNPSNFRQLILFCKTQQEQQILVRKIKEQTILRNMAAADSLAQIEEYPAAISLLEEVYNVLPEYFVTIDTKLGIIKKQYKEKKIQHYTEQGQQLYNAGDYESALEKFSLVLKEDINNKTANERIETISRKLDILHQRGQITYEYHESNPNNYIEFRNALEDELNKLIDNTPDGKLKLDFSILFDTMGINQSYYNIQSFNTIAVEKNRTILESRLSSLLGHTALQPSYREEIPIRSASSFHIDMDWDSHEQIIVKKRKKIVNQSAYGINPLIDDAFQNKPEMYYGQYHFITKNKTVNGTNYHDISLTKYKTVGGEAFFYGIIPGLGTLIATQGKEGATCMVLSLLFYGGAATSYALYNNFKKEYEKTEASLSEEDAKTLNTKKEICKWSAIAGLSIGGTIHFSGMIKALVRGVQNKKASKQLRQALQNEPMEISKENIHLQ